MEPPIDFAGEIRCFYKPVCKLARERHLAKSCGGRRPAPDVSSGDEADGLCVSIGDSAENFALAFDIYRKRNSRP